MKNGSISPVITRSKKGRAENPFMPASEKVTIASLDTSLTVRAQYNPKELGLSKTVQWQAHNERDNRASQDRDAKAGHDSEYNGGGQRNMTVELFFDRYEDLGVEGKEPDKAIEDIMDDLNTLASIRSLSGEEEERRPHYCVVVWGIGGIRPFRCVIEGLEIKYTMFDRLGVPLRATATVKLRETQITAALTDREKASLGNRAAK